jgi:lipopolysaccharide/colanic/teichoic acid biosynthesis glycosyltransferase
MELLSDHLGGDQGADLAAVDTGDAWGLHAGSGWSSREDDLHIVWKPSGYERFVKRGIDLGGALVLLVITLPLLLGGVLAVLVQLGWPVFFVQERIGRDGKPFRMIKLRTMLPSRRQVEMPFVGVDRRRTHKSDVDPRHVPVGRFLRRYSIDELPQLFNVLRGDMSLVGPRPELVEIVREYAPWEHRRHVVRPGITGLWQVTERGSKLMRECVATDLRYVDSLGARVDLRILLTTLPAALGRRRGA